MSKVLIVSLLQVVLAQNFRNARPFVRTNVDTERQFYFRNPDDRNLEVRRQDTEFRSIDLDTYRPHSRPNGEHLYGHQQSYYQPIINEGTRTQNNEYPLTNVPEADHFSEGIDIREKSHESIKVNNSDRRYHRIIVNRKKTQLKHGDDKDALDSNLNTHGVNSDSLKTEYNTKSYTRQTTLNQARTNKNSTDNPDISKQTNIELTTVPVLVLMSVTLKTNPNVHSRFASTETANNSYIEIRNGNDGVTFMDNPKNDTADKAATDNEVRINKNIKDGKDEGDRWIWGEDASATTTTSTEKALPAGGLDDRTSLNGDGCPTGQAKVKGMCIPTH